MPNILPMPRARRYGGRMARALLLTALLLLVGCAGPEPRGYYRPAGAPPQETVSSWVGQEHEVLIEATCQGVYGNDVESGRVGSVHLQLDLARPRSGDLLLRRDALSVELPAGGEGPPRRLALSEAWAGAHRVSGDLEVPGWTRRAFDLFFDDPALLEHDPPTSLRLGWELEQGEEVVAGSCEFVLIDDADPFAPSRLAPADKVFGLRNGYYLPGVRLGFRSLHAQGEERLHYLFHEPE
jgi:hypothetical protein